MVSFGEIERVARGEHHDPHSVLGAHPDGDNTVTVRALRPFAEKVVLVTDDDRFEMKHLHEGVWAVTLDDPPGPYQLAVTYQGHQELVQDDPYRFLPTLGELDLHLITEGRHEELWRVLGAHTRTIDDVAGTSFAVWAPNARGVRVSGDFNYWDGTAHPMRSLGGSGVWELFIPAAGDGNKYKYDVCGPNGSGGRRLTRWRWPPNCRRPPPRWCSRHATTGPMMTGWPNGPARSHPAGR